MSGVEVLPSECEAKFKEQLSLSCDWFKLLEHFRVRVYLGTNEVT